MRKKLIPLILVAVILVMAFVSGNFMQVNLQGLQKAISVANPNATAQLQQNLQRLNQTDMNVLNTLDNLVVTNNPDNSASISGTYPALLFGFIPLQHTYNYQLNNGILSRQKSFFDIFWRNEANL